MRLIDADDLITIEYGGIKFVPKEFIDDAPVFEERKQGRWTYERHENAPMLFKDRWICSACGVGNTHGKTHYCPCCGAMMENSTRRTKEAENGE